MNWEFDVSFFCEVVCGSVESALRTNRAPIPKAMFVSPVLSDGVLAVPSDYNHAMPQRDNAMKW